MNHTFQAPVPMAGVVQLFRDRLLEAPFVHVPHWQGLDVSDRPQAKTVELLNASFTAYIPSTPGALASAIQPNVEWAEAQFQERVAGKPLNPGETYKDWPYYRGNVEEHLGAGGIFSHTYMERFWPRLADTWPPYGAGDTEERPAMKKIDNRGIRYRYGDLSDVLELLTREPYTRQAYLPIFFPEDTGAHHGERIPCTLGYHFILRNDELHIVYPIRSCDFVRHFRDDVYMAGRLCQWVINRLADREAVRVHPEEIPEIGFWHAVAPGTLTMHMTSLHVFEADLPKLRREHDEQA